MEFALVGVGLLAAAAIVLAVRRPTPAGPAAGGSEAVRRDLERLLAEIKASVRDQVERLDREVKRLQEAVAEADRARRALEDARLEAAPRPAAPTLPPKPPSNPLHERVFELRDAGKDPADIGVETGLEVGEVELILGLRRMPPRA